MTLHRWPTFEKHLDFCDGPAKYRKQNQVSHSSVSLQGLAVRLLISAQVLCVLVPTNISTQLLRRDGGSGDCLGWHCGPSIDVCA